MESSSNSLRRLRGASGQTPRPGEGTESPQDPESQLRAATALGPCARSPQPTRRLLRLTGRCLGWRGSPRARPAPPWASAASLGRGPEPEMFSSPKPLTSPHGASRHPPPVLHSLPLPVTWAPWTPHTQTHLWGHDGSSHDISLPHWSRGQALPVCPISPEKGAIKTKTRASLVAQWLRVCLPMRGTRVRALVWEDPTCRGATRPMSHNY